LGSIGIFTFNNFKGVAGGFLKTFILGVHVRAFFFVVKASFQARVETGIGGKLASGVDFFADVFTDAILGFRLTANG
jgi:hypothetical protein